MEFEGTVFKVMPPVSGTSSKGAWRKQDVVFEMSGEFGRKICVTFFGDRSEDASALKEGDAATVSVNVESREYNGKWYTDVKAWKIVRKTAAAPGNTPDQLSEAPFNEDTIPAGENDLYDLPF